MPRNPTAGAVAALNRKVQKGAVVTAIKLRDAGTLKAKDQSFGARAALFARGTAGLGIKPPSELSYFPFTDKKTSDLYANYDSIARGFIYEARKWIGRGVILSGNQGTAPEMCLLGLHLTRGFILGVNLWHQHDTLAGFRANGRLFTVDVSAEYNGVRVGYPVDGKRFHTSSEVQVLDSVQRDYQLQGVEGVIIDVLDTQCYQGTALENFLRDRGIPV